MREYTELRWASLASALIVSENVCLGNHNQMSALYEIFRIPSLQRMRKMRLHPGDTPFILALVIISYEPPIGCDSL